MSSKIVIDKVRASKPDGEGVVTFTFNCHAKGSKVGFWAKVKLTTEALADKNFNRRAYFQHELKEVYDTLLMDRAKAV